METQGDRVTIFIAANIPVLTYASEMEPLVTVGFKKLPYPSKMYSNIFFFNVILILQIKVTGNITSKRLY